MTGAFSWPDAATDGAALADADVAGVALAAADMAGEALAVAEVAGVALAAVVAVILADLAGVALLVDDDFVGLVLGDVAAFAPRTFVPCFISFLTLGVALTAD